jgi:hypothetical protein
MDIDEIDANGLTPDESATDVPAVFLCRYERDTEENLKELPVVDGWYQLDGKIFIQADLPRDTKTLALYCAETGSEQEGVLLFAAERLTSARFAKGWDVEGYFPNGFLGHIWAVTTDADGVERHSGIVKAIYPRPGYDLNGEPLGTPREQLTAYLSDLFTNAYSPYYDGLHYEISNYEESIVGDDYTATFYWKMYHKNYYKDPDTVGYIIYAKEHGDPGYKTLYDEYNQEKEGNFSFQATAKIAADGKFDLSTIEILGDIAVHGPPVYEATVEGYFPPLPTGSSSSALR